MTDENETGGHVEDLRLAALRAYELLDHEPVTQLDGLVALAAQITGAGAAVVNLLDDTRQWQVAAFGGPRREVARSESMCRYVVEQRAPVHVEDAARDPRWAGNPFVTGEYGSARMYASVPLLDADGIALGSLCVVDEAPRRLTTEQLGGLGLLADQVVALFESRRRARRLAAAVEELDRLAHVDALTGLVNRAAAARAIDRVCVRGGWGLLFIDVDDFKTINDDAGHGVGDRALREIAARLRSQLRPHDLLARWSGDEFVALLAGVQEHGAAAHAGKRLADAVRQPFAADGRRLQLSVSVGAAVVRAGSRPADVLKDADRVMYEAKRGRRRATGLLPAGPDAVPEQAQAQPASRGRPGRPT